MKAHFKHYPPTPINGFILTALICGPLLVTQPLITIGKLPSLTVFMGYAVPMALTAAFTMFHQDNSALQVVITAILTPLIPGLLLIFTFGRTDLITHLSWLWVPVVINLIYTGIAVWIREAFYEGHAQHPTD